MTDPSPFVRIRGVHVRYPGVHALDGVSVDLRRGEVHALLGENGAGKSTLGKVLGGHVQPDEGTVEIEGRAVAFRDPREALQAGVAIIHQELLFCENLTVAENLSLGDPPHRGPWMDFAASRQRAERMLEAIGAPVSPDARVGDLTVGVQQLVQIAAGVGRGAQLLIFDEPTASLSRGETEALMALIRRLREQGTTVVYVSHRLEEIFAVCDRVTVLRDGRVVETLPVEGLSREDLVRRMIGREVDRDLAPPVPATEEVALRVRGLRPLGARGAVSLNLRRGEILGLGGLVGSGRTEVLEAIFGLHPAADGSVEVLGRPLRLGDPVRALEAGLGLVPEDRKRHGLVLSLNAMHNITLASLESVARGPVIVRGREEAKARRFFDRMRVKAPSLEAPTAGLSGGNQQKLVIAKWLAAESEVLLVDEPTRGVDVGAKAEIHRMLGELAAAGKAILVVSSDLPELLALSSRVLVMREGRLVGELPGGAEEPEAMRMMAGVG